VSWQHARSAEIGEVEVRKCQLAVSRRYAVEAEPPLAIDEPLLLRLVCEDEMHGAPWDWLTVLVHEPERDEGELLVHVRRRLRRRLRIVERVRKGPGRALHALDPESPDLGGASQRASQLAVEVSEKA